MIAREKLTAYLDDFLQVSLFKDYCPNGLQVQGKDTIKKVVSGVTASQAFIEQAIKAKADALLVHHGMFWKGDAQTITGMRYQRLKTLFSHDLNLLAYHLPLDAHVGLGNNTQLAKMLGIKINQRLPNNATTDLLFVGELETACSPQEFATHIGTQLNREPLHISASPKDIKRVALCTGAAQDYIEQAADAGADAFISGEISERTVHSAKELGIHYYAAGHHATERYGIQRLGEQLVTQFGIEHEFIDVDNPV